MLRTTYAKNDRDKHKEMLKKEAFFPQGRDSSPTMTPQMHQSGDEDTEEEVYCWHGTGGFDAENIYADTQDVSTVPWPHTASNDDTSSTLLALLPSLLLSVLDWTGLDWTESRCFADCRTQGFMMQFASAGFWGRGLYFAKEPGYVRATADSDQSHPPTHQLIQLSALARPSLVSGCTL